MGASSLLRPPAGKQFCKLQDLPPDVRNMMLLVRGQSTKGLHVEVGEFRMAAVAKGIQVPDVIENAFNFLMVSEKLKSLLEANAKGTRIEYLPFRLINHKGRVAADPCFIVNPLGTIDCADKSRSEGVEMPVYPGEFYIARRIVIVEAKVPADVNIFRTALFPPGVWVSEELRQLLVTANVGARFVGSGEEI